MTDNMWDLNGWRPISCEPSNRIRENAPKVSSSLTDPSGDYGPAITYTEWADAEGHPVLRDYLPYGHATECTHYVPRADK